MRKDKKFFYDDFAQFFDEKMNKYDLNKRLKIIFDEFLRAENLKGKKLLDAGCGTGWFSLEAFKRGAIVTSLDVGERMLEEVAKKCDTKRIVGDILGTNFADGEFDYIICTEVIEHTANPRKALKEMYRILKPDGVLVLTTPNKVWYFALIIANLFKLRPYGGYENWVGWSQLKKWLPEIGFWVESIIGFNIVPFVSPKIYFLIDFFDRYGKTIGPLMLNVGIKARKIDNSVKVQPKNAKI